MKYLYVLVSAIFAFAGCSAMDGLFAGETNTSETQNQISDNSSSSVRSGGVSSSGMVSSQDTITESSNVGDYSSNETPLSSDDGMDVRIQYASGVFAAKVPIKLVSQSGWKEGILEDSLAGAQTIVSDDSGYVHIPALTQDTWSLLIAHETEGIFMDLSESLDGDTVKTEPLTNHRGNVGGYVPKNIEICLQSTNYCSFVNDAGDFSFEMVPQGEFDIAFKDDSSKVLTMVSQFKLNPRGEDVDSIYYEKNHITLDDFQDRDHYGSLSTWSGTGHWWQNADGATYWPNENIRMNEGMVEGISGAGDWAYKQQVSFYDTGRLSWMNLGLNLGEGADALTDAVWANISALDSITFSINGTGMVEFFIQSAYTLDDYQDFYVPITLNGGWHEVTIRPGNFIVPEGSLADQRGIGFSRAATRTGAVVFKFLDPGEFIIDDIKIHGIEVIKFFPGEDTGE